MGRFGENQNNVVNNSDPVNLRYAWNAWHNFLNGEILWSTEKKFMIFKKKIQCVVQKGLNCTPAGGVLIWLLMWDLLTRASSTFQSKMDFLAVEDQQFTPIFVIRY